MNRWWGAGVLLRSKECSGGRGPECGRGIFIRRYAGWRRVLLFSVGRKCTARSEDLVSSDLPPRSWIIRVSCGHVGGRKADGLWCCAGVPTSVRVGNSGSGRRPNSSCSCFACSWVTGMSFATVPRWIIFMTVAASHESVRSSHEVRF